MAVEDVKIPSGKADFPGELYSPSTAASSGLVVIAYGTDGFVDTEHGPWKTMIQEYAKDVATQGLFALIPDYFAKTRTKHGGAAIDDIAGSHDAWAAALVDSVAYARTRAGVDASRIGMLGFSLGGYLCLRARAAAKPKALVAYFAPIFEGIGPPGSVPHAQIHHGTLDRFPTAFSNAAAIEGILKLERTDVTVFPYKDATHGFAGISAADTTAATLSKTRTLTFFGARL